MTRYGSYLPGVLLTLSDLYCFHPAVNFEEGKKKANFFVTNVLAAES